MKVSSEQPSLLELVRKRHVGDGWLMFTELGNRPGYYASRYADAFVLGVWASTKYETHLYEEKCHREDLKKELKDPSKMEGVGKYARYRWLVVSDTKIMEGLVIPDAWGILAPTVRGGQRLLKVIRKAPKLDATPIDPLFAIAMIRNALKGWVPTADHQRVVDELEALRLNKHVSAPADECADRSAKISDLQRQLDHQDRQIKAFEEASGVSIALDGYQGGVIGEAVKLVRALQDRGEPLEALGSHVAHLSSVAAELDRRARSAAEAAVLLRHSLELSAREHTARCAKKQSWNGSRCTCGKEPGSQLETEIAARSLEAPMKGA